jgi:pimeloyl-ACP methyl ester carboxylesterase
MSGPTVPPIEWRHFLPRLASCHASSVPANPRGTKEKLVMDEDRLPRYERSGQGEPVLLLHGIGHRRQLWRPVVDRLLDRFELVSVDLPGFGESAPSAVSEPSPEWLAERIESLMDSLDLPSAHLVGNSLGAWIALELARRGRARSVTALMPAGLWRPGHGSDSLRHRLLFGYWNRWTRIPGAGRAARNPVLRTVALVGAFGRPWRVPADVAEADVSCFRGGDLRRTMRATYGRRLTGGRSIAVPVTVVLGTRDPLIRRRDLDMSLVPAGLRLTTLRGAGHVPTWDDPDAVAALVVSTAALAAAPRPGA